MKCIFEQLTRHRRPEPVIAIAFDGVLSQARYRARVSDTELIDAPVPGAINYLLKLKAKKSVIISIYDRRSRYMRGRRAMRQWLIYHASKHCYYSIPTGPEEYNASLSLLLWEQAGFNVQERLRRCTPPEDFLKGVPLQAGRWFVRQLQWPSRIPTARVYISPHAYYFDGSNWPDQDQIINHQPWYRDRGV